MEPMSTGDLVRALAAEDDRNANAVKTARDERLELYWLEDGLAHAPFGMGEALLERAG